MRSKERVGRISVIVIWFAITLTSLLFISSIMLYVAIQLFMIWLIRSLYFYNSVFSALLDLAFVYIPQNFASKKEAESSHQTKDDKFEYAYHAAEMAVGKIFKN